MDKEIEVEVEAARGRKDPGWKYARLLMFDILYFIIFYYFMKL